MASKKGGGSTRNAADAASSPGQISGGTWRGRASSSSAAQLSGSRPSRGGGLRHLRQCGRPSGDQHPGRPFADGPAHRGAIGRAVRA